VSLTKAGELTVWGTCIHGPEQRTNEPIHPSSARLTTYLLPSELAVLLTRFSAPGRCFHCHRFLLGCLGCRLGPESVSFQGYSHAVPVFPRWFHSSPRHLGTKIIHFGDLHVVESPRQDAVATHFALVRARQPYMRPSPLHSTVRGSDGHVERSGVNMACRTLQRASDGNISR